jgi:hypothetical protein
MEVSTIPFKSKAQQKLLESLASKGKFGKGNIKEWETSTKKQPGGFEALPEHVKPKKENRKRTKVKGKAKRGRKY